MNTHNRNFERAGRPLRRNLDIPKETRKLSRKSLDTKERPKREELMRLLRRTRTEKRHVGTGTVLTFTVQKWGGKIEFRETTKRGVQVLSQRSKWS